MPVLRRLVDYEVVVEALGSAIGDDVQGFAQRLPRLQRLPFAAAHQQHQHAERREGGQGVALHLGPSPRYLVKVSGNKVKVSEHHGTS